ncbi:hypothetical protein EYZ11_002974 [Aspergillus tanneri]|uniref:Uncharacterized protein n=1 Tax=Aspergillus tanneri TaxID=1220188 RepID=A0A4S3JTX3_9EURO|nr:hypothetical protein EYZ11_002974 [Aspergillus tanneri]
MAYDDTQDKIGGWEGQEEAVQLEGRRSLCGTLCICLMPQA